MKKHTPINIILLGDPAAGKATHAKHLIKRYPLVDVDMGKELRKLKNENFSLKNVFNSTLDRGKLTPTQIVRKILKEKILRTPPKKGLLLDGTPKMVGEAKLVFKLFKQKKRADPLVIYLTIPSKETIKRMFGRKEYHKGKFSRRTDDSKTALKNRVVYYRKNIAHVVKFFSSKYKFKKVSSLESVPIVQKRLLNIIDAYDKNRSN